MRYYSCLLTASLVLSLAACEDRPSPTSTAPGPAAVGATARSTGATASSASGSTQLASAAGKDSDAARPKASTFAVSGAEFVKQMTELSEPDAKFFSDNLVSNETSYLQVLKTLKVRKKGGIYVGVGPEQNFTYLAATEPDMAYIVDIRRDNLRLHLLYKAAFEEAQSRTDFLCLMVGRETPKTKLAADADVAEVLEAARGAKADPKDFEQIHQRLVSRLTKIDGVSLSAGDLQRLKLIHTRFFKGGVDLKFELKKNSIRKYPTLAEVLGQKTLGGEPGGFLAVEQDFRVVQTMHRENRIVPLVGNFGGSHTLAALGAMLKRQGRTVRSYYVSNVEQYLMQDGLWWKWQRNINALPVNENSVFIRAYLNQGSAHPLEMDGHRSTSVVQTFAAFKGHKTPYRSALALSRDGIVSVP